MPTVLTLLRIKNLALVEELEWQMGSGFIAVTGETGAGKSIVIGALQLLLGEHAALNTAETAREQELDLLRHQITEIKSANLVIGEEEEIEKRYKLASNSKRLIELASAIANRLSESDDSVLSQLAETQRLL